MQLGGRDELSLDSPDTRGLLIALERLTSRLLGARTVVAALQQVVDTAAAVVPAADLVSVTLRAPDGEFFTPVETDAIATELDRAQYQEQDGPCLDVASPDGPGYVTSPDLTVEPRWPRFSRASVGHGLRAVLSTELRPATGTARLAGALNVYSRRTHGFADTDRHIALLLATHGSLALAHARSVELADLHEAQLRHAIDTRDVIGQAKGILMQRQGITADEAFTLLRRTSQDLNVRLVDLARTLTDRHDELDPR